MNERTCGHSFRLQIVALCLAVIVNYAVIVSAEKATGAEEKTHGITVQKKDETVLKCKVVEKVKRKMSDGEVLLLNEKRERR